MLVVLMILGLFVDWSAPSRDPTIAPCCGWPSACRSS
jgi:hypothetical protein